MRLIALLLAVTMPAAVAALASARADDPARLAGRLVAGGAPGAAVGVWDDGTAACASAGVRAAGHDAAVAEGDLWHLGSLTKSMTATLAARIVARGEMDWSDTVGEHLGAALTDLAPGAEQITLEQLLSHRAGLPRNFQFSDRDPVFPRAGDDVRKARLAYARALLTEPLLTRPESAFLYSNAGYVVAGAMIEAATGESWEALLRTEVFEPLGLESAGFGPPGAVAVIDQPRGHRADDSGTLHPVAPGPAADNPPLLGPAGTVHMSACDVLLYGSVHAVRPEAYLPADLWQTLHRDRGGDADGGYALGWRLRQDGGLTHFGSNGLWYARIAVWPGQGRAAVAITNDGRIDRMTAPVQAVIEALAP